uniref:Uncharacterized protein n=1 Tax=Oryza sativa subsp. japonica TaxID=39947 RepID=Q69UF0_ORYSJ|nr:hypothetical protein [Oryza sativa Japonica Group]BAD33119.1 hypothetical protein [Oryza sativa Japonica Group]
MEAGRTRSDLSLAAAASAPDAVTRAHSSAIMSLRVSDVWPGGEKTVAFRDGTRLAAKRIQLHGTRHINLFSGATPRAARARYLR